MYFGAWVDDVRLQPLYNANPHPVPLPYLWSITQMCCQKLLYALTLVVWVYSTPVGSHVWSHWLCKRAALIGSRGRPS